MVVEGALSLKGIFEKGSGRLGKWVQSGGAVLGVDVFLRLNVCLELWLVLERLYLHSRSELLRSREAKLTTTFLR